MISSFFILLLFFGADVTARQCANVKKNISHSAFIAIGDQVSSGDITSMPNKPNEQ
jgi:hypothetical protein